MAKFIQPLRKFCPGLDFNVHVGYIPSKNARFAKFILTIYKKEVTSGNFECRIYKLLFGICKLQFKKSQLTFRSFLL